MKKLVSMALALVMMISFTVPAWAAQADGNAVAVTDEVGLSITFELSNAILGTETLDTGVEDETDVTVYCIPSGTVITPSIPGASWIKNMFGSDNDMLRDPDFAGKTSDGTIWRGSNGVEFAYSQLGSTTSGDPWDQESYWSGSTSLSDGTWVITCRHWYDAEGDGWIGTGRAISHVYFRFSDGSTPAGSEDPSAAIGAYQFHGWAKDQLIEAFDAGLVPEGVLNNDLTAAVTRAQFAAVAVKLYEAMSGDTAPAVTGENPFSDTSDPYVLQAQALGLVDGKGDGSFDPDGILDRESAATLLSKVYVKLGNEIPPAAATDFTDDDQLSSWARAAVSFMNSKGVVNGSNGRFMPKDNMSGEGAVILALQMLQILM